MKRLLNLWNIATGSLLLIAGLLKALDGETLRDVLVYLGVSPATGVLGVAAVVCVEMSLGTWLVASSPSRRAAKVAIGAFTAFTGMLLFLYSQDNSPDCGCLGKVEHASEVKAAQRSGLVRNGFILATGSVILLLQPKTRRAERIQ